MFFVGVVCFLLFGVFCWCFFLCILVFFFFFCFFCYLLFFGVFLGGPGKNNGVFFLWGGKVGQRKTPMILEGSYGLERQAHLWGVSSVVIFRSHFVNESLKTHFPFIFSFG